jgi:uncharacterized protein (DUF1330 family)
MSEGGADCKFLGRWVRLSCCRLDGDPSPLMPARYRLTMPAYVIGETNISDPERYDRYSAAAPATVAVFGGRFIARGGEVVVLEGDWQPKRLVVTEFRDLETAKRLREGAATLQIVAIDGYSGASR